MTDADPDAYGRLLLAAFERGRDVVEIIERDDGFIDASRLGTGLYLAPFRRWPPHHRRAMRFVRGRVLDVGCGAGRVCLHLQARGLDVVGIDVSPGAVEVCRRRGIRDVRLLSVEEVDERLGSFDTIVMLGNNLGLLGLEPKARMLLRRFHALTGERGRLVVESRDPAATDDPAHLRYQERNRSRGRRPGDIRIRVRYRDAASPWFDYPLLSPAELGELLDGTGWRLERVLDSDDTYVAVVDKG